MRPDQAMIDRRMNELLRLCREAGLHVTPQRLTIYRSLLESSDHPSPEMLYQRVLPKMPSLSLATIYKALDALSELGVVREVAVVSDAKRYDANLDAHHHIVCTECKAISDLYDQGLDQVPLPKNLGAFVPEALSVQVFGRCGTCSVR